MEGIPPARASDNEDVIWALETAESLWKKNARVDAIVWLRRAAQEAAEAGDDDRASSLMVEAASLTESLSRISSQIRAGQPITQPPPSGELAGEGANPADLDALLAMDVEIRTPGDGDAVEGIDGMNSSGALSGRTSMVSSSDFIEIVGEEAVSIPVPAATPVPTGEASLEALAGGDDDEVIIDDDVLILDEEEMLDEPPSEASLELAGPTDEAAPEESASPKVAGDVPAEDRSAPIAAEAQDLPLEATPLPPEPTFFQETEGITRMGDGALSPLDLAASPALASASAEKQADFVSRAEVILCAEGVTLPPFALALVLEGELSVYAELDGPLIGSAREGTILRSRGSLDVLGQPHPSFVVGADDTTLAVWSEASLAATFGDDVAVDDELRTGGDRWIAWATLTASRLASSLHEDVRLRLAEQLKTRAVAPDCAVLAAGSPVGGMLLVGYGSVTIDGRELGPGDFVFPEATLSAGKASADANAGPEGAILLVADRRKTQELYATEPLLLELLSSSY